MMRTEGGKAEALNPDGRKWEHRILAGESSVTGSCQGHLGKDSWSQDPVKDILGKTEQAGELGFAGAEKTGSTSGEQQEGFPVQGPDRICPVIIPA